MTCSPGAMVFIVQYCPRLRLSFFSALTFTLFPPSSPLPSAICASVAGKMRYTLLSSEPKSALSRMVYFFALSAFSGAWVGMSVNLPSASACKVHFCNSSLPFSSPHSIPFAPILRARFLNGSTIHQEPDRLRMTNICPGYSFSKGEIS